MRFNDEINIIKWEIASITIALACDLVFDDFKLFENYSFLRKYA